MANREKGGRVVFVGNIHYQVSEEQICDIFARCGTVVGFRYVYDADSGKPKGFGFLEFTDADAAASAVRNLNNFDLLGRSLRVDYSNDNRSQNQNQNQNQHPPAQFGMPDGMNGRPDPSALPPLPPGVELPPGVTVFDAISQTLAQVPTPQLLDFITQIKGLCQVNPAQATALLGKAPQLSYAVFQAMCLLGLVDPNIVTQLIQSQGLQPPQPPPQAVPPPQQYQQPQLYQPPPPTAAYGQYPPPQGYGAGYNPTPPAQAAYQPPPPQAAPQLTRDELVLISQVFAYSQADLSGMDQSMSAQIKIAREELKKQYGKENLRMQLEQFGALGAFDEN